MNPLSNLSNSRFELKTTMSQDLFFNIEAQLQNHKEGFQLRFPDRWVNNLYFDSEGLECCQANLDGISRRVKVRIRWYGERGVASKAKLEAKLKQDQVGWKRAYPIDKELDFEKMSWFEIRQAVSESLPDEIRFLFEEMSRPVLINRYRRSYYESANGKCRVTLDRNIESLSQLFSFDRPNLEFAQPTDSMGVIEFKASDCVQDPSKSTLREVIASFPLLLQKNSKYVRATAGDMV